MGIAGVDVIFSPRHKFCQHFQRAMVDEFTEVSLALHHVCAAACEGPSAMKENIVIPIKIERVKVWFRRTLEAVAWLICLGMLATSIAVAACGVLGWLVSGSGTVLAAGLGGAVLLGLAGVWQLLGRLDRAAKRLRNDAAGAGCSPS